MLRLIQVPKIVVKIVSAVALVSAALVLGLANARPAPPANDAADQAMATITADAIRSDMRFLADDALEGRGTATRGHEIAAKYMASRFEGMGLQPGGENGSYFQQVPLRSFKTDEAKSSLTVTRNGQALPLMANVDFILTGDPSRPDVSVEAPVVFAGFGVTAPDQNYDDYKSIDVKGKIVAFVLGAPNFESSLKAHYSSLEVKAQTAVDHGAVGTVAFDDPISESIYPFDKWVRDLENPEYRWIDKGGRPNDEQPRLKGGALLNLSATKALFEGTPHTGDEIFAGVKAGKLGSFPLPITAKMHTVTDIKETHSPNVIAKLEGSDPILKGEYIVYTAHLDHLGIGAPVNGDAIYNGALDNASGSATILEVAQAFVKMNPRPRRSILFVSVTGEEAGELGSLYFAHYPTVAKNSIVADINVDEVFLLWPMQDVIAFGAEHSSLESAIRRAAERMHIVESRDPMPEQTVFIRSDQYSFVLQGIPAVMPSPGFKSNNPNVKPFDSAMAWMTNIYHQPQDDMNQPGLDFEAAADFARFTLLTGYYVAQDPQRPTWNKGDFFGDRYGHLAK